MTGVPFQRFQMTLLDISRFSWGYIERISVIAANVFKCVQWNLRKATLIINSAFPVTHLNTYYNCYTNKTVIYSLPTHFLFFNKSFHYWPHIAISKLLLCVYFTLSYSLVHFFAKVSQPTGLFWRASFDL